MRTTPRGERGGKGGEARGGDRDNRERDYGKRSAEDTGAVTGPEQKAAEIWREGSELYDDHWRKPLYNDSVQSAAGTENIEKAPPGGDPAGLRINAICFQEINENGSCAYLTTGGSGMQGGKYAETERNRTAEGSL